MTDPNWDRGIEVKVLAVPEHGNWTRALDYIDAAKRLKFDVADMRDPMPPPPAAQGADPQPANALAKEANKWTYAKDKECGADGDPKAPVNPANCLLPDAPPGSLIAKIGGSPAGKISDALKSFVVGSFCIIDIDDKSKGTLYLTMNMDPMGMTERKGHLLLKVYRSV